MRTVSLTKSILNFCLCRNVKGEKLLIKESRFEALLKKNWGIRDFEDVKDPMERMGLNFALSTIERGEAVKNLVSQYIQIEGKRYLDVGCAYGGFLVAFKKAGASEVVGVDIDPVLLVYCKALLQDHCLDVPSYQKDILEKGDIQALGTFDIITCNDVIEHVKQPNIAISHMASMLKGNGVLFMEIPNRLYAPFIQSDGHFNLFGITVLPKWIADPYLHHFYPNLTHDVRYRSLRYYLNALRGAGLSYKLINPLDGDEEGRLQVICKTFQACRQQINTLPDGTPLYLREVIKKRVLRIIGLFERKYKLYLLFKERNDERAEGLAHRLICSFGENFWRILAKKEGFRCLPGAEAKKMEEVQTILFESKAIRKHRRSHVNPFRYAWKFRTYTQKHGLKKALRKGFEKLKYLSVERVPPIHVGASPLGKSNTLCYRCNICGKECESKITDMTRENPSCIGCGSTVRMRAIIRTLSLELFGESLPISDFPIRPDIIGMGMSDWGECAERLKRKLNYRNTYYHKEPKLDILSIPSDLEGKFDFIISTDVFEHVEPPISIAFENTRKLLKLGGVLIFSAPYLKEGKTIEHFPELYKYEIVKNNDGCFLKNITRNGVEQIYDHLVFHGGEGTTLEMRSFSEGSLMEEFRKAGFSNIKICKDEDIKHGIRWEIDCSFPIAARIK
jgi:2-polyprenyl-3-methyl-5-hydroxy-6-metoxy-1,4-benzoquinol methylase